MSSKYYYYYYYLTHTHTQREREMREMRDERDKRVRETLLGNNVHRISFLLQLSLSLSLSLYLSLSLSLSLSEVEHLLCCMKERPFVFKSVLSSSRAIFFLEERLWLEYLCWR